MVFSNSLMIVGSETYEENKLNDAEGKNSPNFEVTITSPEDGEFFQEDETVTIEYKVENTGDIEDTQEIVQSANGEKIDITEKTIGAGMSKTGHYQFNASYWSEQFTIETVELDSIWSPDRVELGEEFEANGTGYYDYVFPEKGEVALREDHMEDYRFTLRNKSEEDILIKVPADEIELTPKENYSTFEASVPTEGLEEGNYTLQLEALQDGMYDYRSVSRNLTLVEPKSDYEKVINDDEPDDGRIEKENDGGKFEAKSEDWDDHIEYELKVSSEDDEDTIRVKVGEDEFIHSLTLKIEGDGTVHRDFDPEPIAIAVNEHTTLYELEPRTEVTLEIDEDNRKDFEKWTLPDELSDGIDEDATEITFLIEDDYTIVANFEEEIPGFKTMTLPLAIVIALAIYNKKEKL